MSLGSYSYDTYELRDYNEKRDDFLRAIILLIQEGVTEDTRGGLVDKLGEKFDEVAGALVDLHESDKLRRSRY